MSRSVDAEHDQSMGARETIQLCLGSPLQQNTAPARCEVYKIMFGSRGRWRRGRGRCYGRRQQAISTLSGDLRALRDRRHGRQYRCERLRFWCRSSLFCIPVLALSPHQPIHIPALWGLKCLPTLAHPPDSDLYVPKYRETSAWN